MLRASLRRLFKGNGAALSSSSYCLPKCSAPMPQLNGMLRRVGGRNPFTSTTDAAVVTASLTLTLAIRTKSSASAKTGWLRSSCKRTWRQPKRQAPRETTVPARISSKKQRSTKKVKSARKRTTTSRSASPPSAQRHRRRRRQRPHKLNPYQRQTEKYNKRVVAIARLWKEQRQGVQKKKSLASRLAQTGHTIP
jgi:hypothetical protein